MVLGGTNEINGFLESNWEELSRLQKALHLGNIEGTESGGPLRVESLESTLKTVTYREEHLKFWRAIAKKRAFNIVEEYNRLVAYGSSGEAFFEDGGLPMEENANYERDFGVVKLLCC